jgi:hypothetical protein
MEQQNVGDEKTIIVTVSSLSCAMKKGDLRISDTIPFPITPILQLALAIAIACCLLACH